MMTTLSKQPSEIRRGRPSVISEEKREMIRSLFPEPEMSGTPAAIRRTALWLRGCAIVRERIGQDCWLLGSGNPNNQKMEILRELGKLEESDVIASFAERFETDKSSAIDAVKMIRSHRGIEKPTATAAELSDELTKFIDGYRERHEIGIEDVADALASVAITVERMID